MTVQTDPAARLVDADREAALARQRLSGTVAALQAKLDPSRFANRTLREVQVVGDVSAAIAKQNRGVIAGAVAAIGLFLLRRPLMRLFSRTSKPAAQPTAQPAAKPMAAVPGAPTATPIPSSPQGTDHDQPAQA